MNKGQTTVFIVAMIGTFSTIASSVGIIRGGAFSDHYLGIFCGITLIGSAFIHHLEVRRNK